MTRAFSIELFCLRGHLEKLYIVCSQKRILKVSGFTLIELLVVIAIIRWPDTATNCPPGYTPPPGPFNSCATKQRSGTSIQTEFFLRGPRPVLRQACGWQRMTTWQTRTVMILSRDNPPASQV
ncbi:MAG: type II secretion system protein [Phycisphaerae bacterium]|nr:type II secretion system protein [Phycisphaerae bacterium]